MAKASTAVPTTSRDVGGMAFYTNSRVGRDITLPLRMSPIRFGVLRRNGLSSNAWRAWVEKSGDIYVACRDHMKELKISLHQSGRQHIAFTSESGLEMTKDSRFWNQWWEPQFHNGPKVVPSFNLLFPSWGLSLTQAIRDASPKVWNKNQIFVEAAEPPFATIVSLIVTDVDLEMRFTTIGESRSFPMGVIPARSGKKLWVTAHHAPEENMKELAGHGIRGLGADAAESLNGMPNGHVLGMCVTGPMTDGGAYMMPFPVTMHWKGDLKRGRRSKTN